MNYHALIRDLAVITFATVVPALALYGLLFAAMVETTGLGWLSRLVQRVRPLRKATSSFDAVALASSDMIPGSLPALRRADWRGR